MKQSFYWVTVAVLVLPLCSRAADPVVASWSSSNSVLVTTPDSIQQTAGNVVMTARGYVAEFDDTEPSKSYIIGPFSTGVIGNHQIFGPRTASAGDNNSFGLGLFVAATHGVAPTGFDYGGQTYIAGFDSGACCTTAYLSDNPDVAGAPRQQKTDFTIISFSSPVAVSQFTSNTANAWWVAGWAIAPNLSTGLGGALATATAIQSRGNQVDPFIHNLSGFAGVTAIAVGYSPRVPGYEALGSYNPGDFFLNSITITPVPEPSTWNLYAVGALAAAAYVSRANKPSYKGFPRSSDFLSLAGIVWAP